MKELQLQISSIPSMVIGIIPLIYLPQRSTRITWNKAKGSQEAELRHDKEKIRGVQKETRRSNKTQA